METNTFIDDFTEKDKVNLNTYHDFKLDGDILGILDHIDTGTMGKVFIFKTANGEVSVNELTALRGKIEVEDIGKKIKIHYLGETKSKTGRLYLNFEVFKK